MERRTVTRDRHGQVIRLVEVDDYLARLTLYLKLAWRVTLFVFALGMIAGATVMWCALPHQPLRLW